MKKERILLVGVSLVLLTAISGGFLFHFTPWSRPDLRTARNHPMQYYISLPDNWLPTKEWPILITIDGANKDYLHNVKAFMSSRHSLPFIIVTPFVVSNGPDNDHTLYNYSDAVWQQIVTQGPAQFDYDGVMAIASDIQKDYNGLDKLFLTGWSAGGHFTWQMIFNHPEKLAAATLAAANYAGRGITTISTDPARVHLPIKGFQGDADQSLVSLNGQWDTVQKLPSTIGTRIFPAKYSLVGITHRFPTRFSPFTIRFIKRPTTDLRP